MKQITKTLNLFTFEQLNLEAQERAERAYLDDEFIQQRKSEMFSEWCLDYANAEGNDVFVYDDITYKLCYCQDDYLALEGRANVLAYLLKHKKRLSSTALKFDPEVQRFKMDGIGNAADVEMMIEISEYLNPIFVTGERGAEIVDFMEFNYYAEEYGQPVEKVVNLFEELEERMKEEHETIVEALKEQGYEHFYELSESDYEELNEWYFLEDGEAYGRIEDIEAEEGQEARKETSLLKVLSALEEGEATHEQTTAAVGMIDWIRDETTRRGSEPNIKLYTLAADILDGKRIQVAPGAYNCFSRLVYTKNGIQYQPAQNYPEELNHLKKILLKTKTH